MAYASDDEFESEVLRSVKLTKDKLLEVQHGSLLALSHIMERKLMLQKNSERKKELLEWNIYVDTVKVICKYTFLFFFLLYCII